MIDVQSGEVTDNEMALVAMALQPRGHRANLSEAFLEIHEKPELKVRARVAMGYANVAFVFMLGSSDDRQARTEELGLRCLVVRGIVSDVITVVGIATDRPGGSRVGYSSDIVYISMQEWPAEYSERVKEIQEKFGYFQEAKPEIRKGGRSHHK